MQHNSLGLWDRAFSFLLINNQTIMKTEVYETIGVNIKVEIFDLDMREIIWPMSDDDDDKGVWLPKEVADKCTDDQIGKWF